MSDLVVVAYPDMYRAAEVLATLRRLQHEYLIDLEDAVYVTKDEQGKVKLHQSVDLAAQGAAGGFFVGALVGLLFLNPLLGALVGAGAGALSGSLTDYGINDDFIRELSAQLTPGSSAIFILVRKMAIDKVEAEIGKFGGTVLRTSFTTEQEKQLQDALSHGGVSSSAQA